MRLLLALVLVAAVAPSAVADEPQPPGRVVEKATSELELGNYETVVELLKPLVDANAEGLAWRQERIEALRAYGIACTMTHRRVSAEGAFAQLLHEEPTLRFDPALVQPEAVALLETVRSRFVVVSTVAPPHRPSRRFIVGAITASLAVATGAAAFGLDVAAYQAGSGSNLQYAGIIVTGASVALTAVGVGVLIDLSRRR